MIPLDSDARDLAYEAGFVRTTPRRPQEVSNAERAQIHQHSREFMRAGFGGIDPRTGYLVDRRWHPHAMPMPANALLGVPPPATVLREAQVLTSSSRFPGTN